MLRIKWLRNYMVLLKVFSILMILFLVSTTVKAQSFGFGCLGLVGGYGGYSYQIYKPEGLNSYVSAFNTDYADSMVSPMDSFGKSRGYRVGINFFRANIEGFILTTKGFYQSLSEKHEATTQSPEGNVNTAYELKMKSWGVGVDLGTAITKGLSWKVVDAAVLFNTADFTNTKNSPGAVTNVLNYSTEKSVVGYSVGTGFILNVIDNYISIEGLAAFTVFPSTKMVLQEGADNDEFRASAVPEEIGNFIEAGGFNAVLQLNVGFPL